MNFNEDEELNSTSEPAHKSYSNYSDDAYGIENDPANQVMNCNSNNTTQNKIIPIIAIIIIIMSMIFIFAIMIKTRKRAISNIRSISNNIQQINSSQDMQKEYEEAVQRMKNQ